MSEEVDLIVGDDQHRAEQIVDALKRGGIDHVEWRRDSHRFFGGATPMGGGRTYWATVFHICVREEDLAQAQHVLQASGLASDHPTTKSTGLHLFGDAQGSHMAHFHARHENGCVELDWEARYGDKLRWRVLRSEQGFAESAEPPGTNGQVLVTEDTETHHADRGLDPSRHFYYTVFSQKADGTWCEQVKVKLRPHELLGFLHPHRQDTPDAEASSATSVAPSQPRQMPLPEDGHPSAQMPAFTDRAVSAGTTGALWSVAAPPDEEPQPGAVSAPSAPSAPSPPQSID